MLKVLIIKISSLGDIIHTLPALSDAKKFYKDISFDWVVSPAFSEIPLWHSSVKKIIPCNIRKWKSNWKQALFQGEIKKFIHLLREESYDLIIDAQSALKTAIIGKLARGKTAGFDNKSAREYGAQWFYHKHYSIKKNMHAISRLRYLFSSALEYPFEATVQDFGIDENKLPPLSFSLPEKYIILIPNTTWPTKHWPDLYWQTIAKDLEALGFDILIPWGTTEEKKRAENVARENKKVWVLPKLSLGECAQIIKKARAALCVDTGLGHLTSALNTPGLHLYGPTNPHHIGAMGKKQILIKSDLACETKCKKLCFKNNKISSQASCLSEIRPKQILKDLEYLLEGSTSLRN